MLGFYHQNLVLEKDFTHFHRPLTNLINLQLNDQSLNIFLLTEELCLVVEFICSKLQIIMDKSQEKYGEKMFLVEKAQFFCCYFGQKRFGSKDAI